MRIHFGLTALVVAGGLAFAGCDTQTTSLSAPDQSPSFQRLAPLAPSGVLGQSLVTGGVGVSDAPGSFSVNIPVSNMSEVVSATFYYCGSGSSSDNTVVINGTEYVADLMGQIQDAYWYKLDGMALVAPGDNTFDVSGMIFGLGRADGIGLAVVYEDPSSDVIEVQILELVDYFYWGDSDGHVNSNVHNFPVTSAPVDRPGDLVIMVGDCVDDRPDAVWYHSGAGDSHPGDIVGGPFPREDNVFNSANGAQFDIYMLDTTVPAGAEHFAFQCESPEAGNGDSGLLIFAAFMVPKDTPPDGGEEGCSHGFWKRHLDQWNGTGYVPSQMVQSVFSEASAYPSIGTATLLEGLKFGGGNGVLGGARNLIKQAVASVLNSVSVDFPMSEAEVIAAVNAALASGDRHVMLDLADNLDVYNNLGCPY